MRIVVTKNGTKIIEDLSLNNSIDYNSDTNPNFLSLDKIKSRLKNIKKNKSVKNIQNNKQLKNKQLYSKSLSNLNKDTENIQTNNIINTNIITNTNLNNNVNNIKMIKLKNNKKFKLPKLMEERYILYDSLNQEEKNTNNNFIPKILLSINNSIDNDFSHKKDIKRNKTISNIMNINNTEKEENNNLNINNDIDEINMFPKIRKTIPLKYIINKESYRRLNKEMKIKENCCNIEKKLFPQNYFLKNNWENLKKNFELSLKNEINSKNVNLIEYLNKNKNLSNIFLQKFSTLDKDKINKLDSISKKLLEKKDQDKQIIKNIKNKIKANIFNININLRQGLNTINHRLNEYGLIIKKDKDKVLLNDKNRYLEQFMDNEKNWERYNLERFYKKSASPKRSMFTPLIE